METIAAAAQADRSLIFTYAPEASVAEDLPQRVEEMVTSFGGKVVFIALTVSDTEQELRINSQARAEFGKLRSLELLRELRPSMRRCAAMMPVPQLVIDTDSTLPEDAAASIAHLLRAP